ncbi:potassium channel family protein [Paractinoplanes brasiliensis]|uniref:Trk system potassium uptake protein TrkA n=1 Tax=Paractinoplanes brasiliensis TaxID=52695 RepID=A0A4R6JBA7_9ACTN|nr:TrkA family potassium uptake protein [Actinoplanes brasiliensis]TDO32979.1 trk system potassium uptake protein TrkA [Actinoplanes brasiliensis]GID28698.1 potassium transporter [Actinoplanes brasiliensis]
MAEKDDENVVVIGLGRFGGQVADSLLRLGHEVLGIDEDPELVQQWSDRLTHVVQADATDEDALLQVGIKEFDRAVVGIGNDIEASVLTVVTLSELGVGDIWAKAVSPKHGRILRSVGAHHVIHPEITMGERVAHLIASRMLDFFEFDDGFAIARTRAPRDSAGRTLADLALLSRHGITVVGVKTHGTDFVYAAPETVVPEHAELVVAGRTELVQRFAATT